MKDFARSPNSKKVLDTIVDNRTRLVSIAARIVQCPHLAEDVVQDAALKVCQASSGRCVECPLHFACRVVRNLAIDRARRRALEHRHAAPEAAADQVEAHDHPEARMAGCQTLAIVRAMLDELPNRTRLAFEMNRLEGIPQKDVAMALGVSPTLVNFMIRDAERHCRSRVQMYETADSLPVAASRRSADPSRYHAGMAHSRSEGAGQPASA